jgi:HAD superfamily hydrolase (TIGR01509 family)
VFDEREAPTAVTIEAVFFDLGGVILRTEHQAPREHLAERLSLSYDELSGLVFGSESARDASLGRVTPAQHWEAVAKRLGRPPSEIAALRDEFFGGDVLDRALLDLIRSLRPRRRTGLISNAWLDLRDYIGRNAFEDAFDSIVVSAEVGVLKPDPAIYKMAMDSVGASPAQSLMVDDTAENIAGAEALGMHGILFRDPEDLHTELRRLLS